MANAAAFALTLLLSIAGSAAAADQAATTDQVTTKDQNASSPAPDDGGFHPHGLIAPYGWAMSVSGKVGLSGVSVPLEVQSSELLKGVKSGGMGYAQAPIGNNFIYIESLAVNFGYPRFPQFFNQSVTSSLFFGETGFGRNFQLDSGFLGEGKTTLSPYVGIRLVDLKVQVNGPFLMERAKKDWHDPALGIVIQGPVWRSFGYVVKLDAAGFNTDGDNYHSELAMLTYTYDKTWSAAAGYRFSHFKAQPSSANGLALDLKGSGPLAGITFTF